MPTDIDRIVRLEDRVNGIDKNVSVLEETTRYASEIQKDLNSTMKELNATLMDMRVTQEGLANSNEKIQGEIAQHTKVIEQISGTLERMKEQSSDVVSISSKLDAHIQADREDRQVLKDKLQEHSGKFDAIRIQIEAVDDKTKLDVGKLAVNFVIYLLGGAGAFSFAMYVLFNYILKIPNATP